MDRKSMARQALRQFVRDYGVPDQLTSDGASKHTGPKTKFMQIVRKYGIEHNVSEPHRPQQNRSVNAVFSPCVTLRRTSSTGLSYLRILESKT